MRHEFSAGFISVPQNSGEGPRFLLLDYGKHWDYPKGHLEEGETNWQAAVRELREETGIKQVDRVGKFEHPLHYFFHSAKKGYINKTVTFFLGCTKALAVKLSDEHENFAWLPYEEALERLTYKNARETLQAAWASLNE